jgi:hypothetical protein
MFVAGPIPGGFPTVATINGRKRCDQRGYRSMATSPKWRSALSTPATVERKDHPPCLNAGITYLAKRSSERIT